LAMGATSIAACSPLVVASFTADSGLVAYARGWHVNNLPYAWLSYAGYLLVGSDGLERYLRAAVGVACAGISLALALRPISGSPMQAGRDLVARLGISAAFVFYLSPAQFPWYAFWFLPFAVIAGNWALIVATAALPSYFLFFPLAESGAVDLFRYWLSGLHLLPVVVVLILQRSRRMNHR
jgi:alpha-1,6-mannosyltransferase